MRFRLVPASPGGFLALLIIGFFLLGVPGCVVFFLSNGVPLVIGGFQRGLSITPTPWTLNINVTDAGVDNEGAKIWDKRDIAWGGGYMTFTVNADTTTLYNLTINSTYGNVAGDNNGSTTVDVSVNGGQANTVILANNCTASHDAGFFDCSSAPISVRLQQGSNTIKLFNETGWAACSYYLTDCTHVQSITLTHATGN